MYASGYIYLTTKKPISYKKFAWKKIKRLGIPYILVSWLIICIKLLVGRVMLVEHPVSFSTFYEILYFPTAGFYLWFVYVLFFIFLIIPIFNTPRKINILLILSLTWLIIPVHSTSLFCIEQCKLYLFYFVLGCFIKQYQSKITTFTSNIPTFIPVLCFIALYVLFTFLGNLSFAVILSCIHVCLALTGIWSLLIIARLIEMNMLKLTRFIVIVASYSYTIYLFHTIFEGLVKYFFIKYPITDFLGYYSSFFIMVLCTVSIGILGPILLNNAYKRIKSAASSFFYYD